MFERFTAGARRVLVRAQEEARLLGHHEIDTDHLLLGILADETSPAGTVLQDAGVSADALREAVKRNHEHLAARATGSPPFTSAAKKALELSLRTALQRGDNFIGPLHLLLGILRLPEDPAVKILSTLGVDLPVLQRTLADTPFTAEGDAPATTGFSPAAGRILPTARRLAATGPLRTHELLLAMFEDPDSAAAKALASLGITRDDVQRALEQIDVDGTTDAS